MLILSLLSKKSLRESKNLRKIKTSGDKFYGFTGSDFIWPYELNTYEHREVFDYIVDPINGKELATNTIEYRLLESGDLDESKGTHVLLVHGKVIRYGDKISSEEHKELQKNFQDASTHLLLNVLLSYADSQLLMIMKGKSGRFV
ncbi:unnamed protein product [Rhizophagus irregularis]|nr:unnamed protein product [Rhizophagus irregularis]